MIYAASQLLKVGCDSSWRGYQWERNRLNVGRSEVWLNIWLLLALEPWHFIDLLTLIEAEQTTDQSSIMTKLDIFWRPEWLWLWCIGNNWFIKYSDKELTWRGNFVRLKLKSGTTFHGHVYLTWAAAEKLWWAEYLRQYEYLNQQDDIMFKWGPVKNYWEITLQLSRGPLNTGLTVLGMVLGRRHWEHVHISLQLGMIFTNYILLERYI